VLPFPSQVVYNRVGKCGSRTVVLLLRILSEKHGFNLVTSDIHNKTRLTKNEQMELIKNISTAEQPYLFTRHVHFLNFSRFGGDQPVYINIIRDPVSRFLSNYFFRRFGDWRGEQNHMIRTPSMRQEERYLDINECILENYPECSNPRLFYIIPYFCGQHPRCREPGEWALERAKLNVNENFLLVGILEELEDVLLLLERFLPHYFKGVLSIYKDPAATSSLFADLLMVGLVLRLQMAFCLVKVKSIWKAPKGNRHKQGMPAMPVSLEGTKAQGNWSLSGEPKSCCLGALPTISSRCRLSLSQR
ncbi:Uronyl 2-sulfotransferase, partial [Sciurus carolinensis]|nr:Uronyl 2-sulfotransferase [Sciurus carolinensis]